MKKNKFILAAAFAAVLVSCSQDENLNSSNDYTQLINSGQIAFATTNASKADTRAGETLTELSNFYVTAVNNSNAYYFKEQQFNKEGSVFTSPTKFYWPTTGTLSFYAVNYMGTISSATAVPTYTYTEWDGNKDLVAATVKASEKQIPCPLTFKHLTAKVGYSAKAKDQTEELSYSLYAVRMTTPAKGTYTFDNASQGTGTWSIDNNTTKTYDYGLPSSGVTFNQTGNNASGNTTFNVLPVTDGNITFEVEYKVLKNGNVISDFTGTNKKTVTVSAPNLTPGKKYVYNFLLTRGTDETITFTTTVTAWETGDTQDVDVYNDYSLIDVNNANLADVVNLYSDIRDMAAQYISDNGITANPDLYVCQYGRINRYNDATWQIAGGTLNEGFKTMADQYYSKFSQIQKINLPNGDVLDAPHFWAVLNTMMTGFGDLGGWGGDLVEFAANVKADNSLSFPSGNFDREDWVSDADGYNIYTLYPDNILLGLKTYYTSTLTEKYRVITFKTEETIATRFQNSSKYTYLAVLMKQKGVTSTDVALAAQKMQDYIDANSR